jgi:hypothetical protein
VPSNSKCLPPYIGNPTFICATSPPLLFKAQPYAFPSPNPGSPISTNSYLVVLPDQSQIEDDGAPQSTNLAIVSTDLLSNACDPTKK